MRLVGKDKYSMAGFRTTVLPPDPSSSLLLQVSFSLSTSLLSLFVYHRFSRCWILEIFTVCSFSIQWHCAVCLESGVHCECDIDRSDVDLAGKITRHRPRIGCETEQVIGALLVSVETGAIS